MPSETSAGEANEQLFNANCNFLTTFCTHLFIFFFLVFQDQSRSIERLISRHFYPRHFDAFREMQALTGLIISGSTTLNFFTFEGHQSSDLDLYVNILGAEYVSVWLDSVGCKPHFRLDPISFQFVVGRRLQEMLGMTLEDVRALVPADIKRKMQDLGGVPMFESEHAPYMDSCRYTSPHLLGVIDYLSAKGSRIQLMVCVGGVMDCVLRFHSSTLCAPSMILTYPFFVRFSDEHSHRSRLLLSVPERNTSDEA